MKITNLTSTPVMAGPDVVQAEFIRLPRPRERCKVSELSRTTLCELISGGKIKAVKLRKKGALRGIVLIHRESLLRYLHEQAAIQATAQREESNGLPIEAIGGVQ